MRKRVLATTLSLFAAAGAQAQSDLPFEVESVTSFDEPWALLVRREDPETHKRLIIIATLPLLSAAIDRIAWLPTTRCPQALPPSTSPSCCGWRRC